MSNILKTRLLQLMTEQSHSARSLSLAAGFGATHINDFISGKKEAIRPKSLAAIASVLGVTTDYLNGLTNDRLGQAAISNGTIERAMFAGQTMPITGKISAGSWIEPAPAGAIPAEDVTRPVEFRNFEGLQAFRLATPDAQGVGITGSHVVAYVSPGVPSGAQGELVVMRRSMADKVFEYSIRRVEAGRLVPTAATGDQIPVELKDAEIVGMIRGFLIIHKL